MEPLNQPAERLQPGNSPPRIFRVLIVAIPWLVLATVFYFAFTGDWFSAWQKVRVTPLHTPFLDLQGFPTGLQVYRQGGDPLIANPLDPRKRPLNYPRLMMFLFAALGITQKNLPLFGVLLCALYLTCITALIWRARSRLEAVLLLVASLSAAPLLAVSIAMTLAARAGLPQRTRVRHAAGREGNRAGRFATPRHRHLRGRGGESHLARHRAEDFGYVTCSLKGRR